MPLDSLGLGLTLDTTLLKKADNTLENMHKNSKLIMQNLTRGFTSFNSGGADALTKMSTALGHVSDALTKIDNAKVSPDFDTKGQDKYIDRMQQLLDIVEKMSKIRGAKFYDPTEIYVTDKTSDKISGEIAEVREHKEELSKLLDVIEDYNTLQKELQKTINKTDNELAAQNNKLKANAESYRKRREEQEKAEKTLQSQYKRFATTQLKKDSTLTEEALSSMFKKRMEDPSDSMNKYAIALSQANEKLKKEEEALGETLKKIDELEKKNIEAKKEYQKNLNIYQNRDQIKSSYDILKEEEKNLKAELKFSQATQAERAAMLTKKNEAEIKADQKRIRDVQKSYETLRKEIQKGEKDIADLEASRQTLKEANRQTKGIDNEIKKRRNELNKLMQDELEFRSSQYWPKLQAIDEKFNSEAFIKNQKALAKLAAKESRKDVTAALQFSRNAQTINEEKEAIKRLVEARDNLSTSTARYKKTVEDINKRILAHKDHIEAVTRVEKEQNTLADSVINRYRKQLKALDEVNEALEKQMKIEHKTSVADLDKSNADTKALLARQQTIADDIVAIEKQAQGELKVIREQHDAERAKKSIEETLRQNEREKQEYAKLLDEKYALKKQRKAMDEAGIPFYETEYQNNVQQEEDIDNRIKQLRQKHLNDLADIDKAHNKRVNDDAIKERIASEKEKLRIAEEYAKKQREKAKKYGTISSASADRLIGVTDNAKNINQHKAAIEKLTQARASLNNTDKGYLETIKRLNNAIKYHEIEIELADDKSNKLMQTHRGLMDIGGQLMRRLALAFSVSQLTQYFRKLVEVRGEFEKTEVALTTILKSRAQANVLMNQITDLAVKSPFTLQQLVGYTKQLAAYQIEYKKLYSTTKMLADVSAGLGVEMDRLILAFGQVRAANFLRATEVRQFTEAGFDILGELAKHYSTLKGEMVSVAEVQEMVTKRMVGFADVEKVFQNVTSAGGIFYDMQAKQAETLAGQWSNLQDKISIMYNEIGKSTDGMLKGIVSFLASLIDNWEGAATVLKGVVTAFAMVKINAALTSKETIKFVRSMGLIKGRVKAVSVIKLLGAAFVQLWRSIKAAGAALKAFAVNNPYIAAIAALVGVIGAVASKHRKQENAVKEVVERYDQLHESITDVNGAMLNAINEQDLDKQKDALKELVDMVDKEYNMKINIDIEELSPEEVASKFNEIMDEAEKLNIFGELFGSGLEGFKAEGQNALKDISQYGVAANDLFKQMVDKSNMVASALQEIDAEKYKDIIKDLVTPRDRKGGESELAYLNRLYEAYMKIKEESSIDLSWDDDTEQYIVRTSDNFYELGKILGEIDFNSLSLDYANALKELKDVEFVKYLDTLTDSLEGLTDEQKEKKLKFAIDTEATHREWNAFVVQLMYEIANQKFTLNIKPTIEAPDEVKWKEWQENYKKKFESEEGYMRITSPSITQEAQIKALNEEYAKQYDLLERIKNAGGESALEVGGAYEGLGKTMAEIEAEMEDVNAQIEYLGGKNTTIDKNEKASQKILNRRISILKEIHEAYNQARKDDLGHEEAVQKVTKDWGDTFKEAFKGTSMSLTRLFVDKGKLTELQEAGKESGKVFSDAMLEEMNKMAEDGTYIRKASDKFKEKLKEDEGLRLQLYDDKTGKIIKNATDWANKVGTATIGWGHAVDTLAEATKYFGKTITEAEAQSLFNADVASKQEELNEVLDAYKELIVTQEQYDALLNRTFQGGGGMTEAAIKYATDTEAAIKYFEILDTKLQKHGMTFAEEFGEDFVENFKEAETVAERLALVLRTIGLTTKASGSQIDPDLYAGMKKRAEERAAEFTGDLEIVKLLEKASTTIADFDFATPEGLVKALRGLMPIAKKEGREAMLVLSKEISKVENEIGVKIRLENVEDFKVDVEKTLGDYKLWKDIEKLQMPDDVASKIFGVTPKTLQHVREEVLKALNLGDDINLGNEDDVLAAVKLQYGDPTEEVVRNFFKNINQIQRAETEEQAKRFVKFLTKNLDQTKVIMSQKGIDIAFAKEQFDKGAISAQTFAETVREISKQANEDISKINFENFKEGSLYIKAMGNLAAYSAQELKAMAKELKKALAENAKDMGVDELQAYHQALARINKETKKFKPFISENEISQIAEYLKLQKELRNEQEKQKELQGERVRLDNQRKSLVELLEQASSRQQQGELVSTNNLASNLQKTEEAIQGIDSMLSNSEMNISNISGQIGEIVGTGGGGAMGVVAMIDKIVQAVNDTCNAAKKTFEDIMEMADSFGVETDKGSWREASNFFEGMSNFNAEVTEGWENLKSGNIFGAIANTIGSISGFIRDVNKWKDSNLEETLQKHREEVEELQTEYEKLEWVIERALSFDKYGKVAQQTENLGKQIEHTSKAIALEEDKKDTDEDTIKELRENAEEARKQIHELYDNLREEIVGSYEDLSSTLADAMIDALKNGENALKAWSDEVDNIIANIVTKLAVQKYVEPQVSSVLDQFYNKVMPKNAAAEKAFTRLQSMTVGTKEYEKALAEWEKLNSQAIGELPQLTENSVNNLKESLNAIGLSFEPLAEKIAGIFGGQQSGELSSLQKGIQGITEDTAQIIEAYLNSVRGYVSEQVTHTKNIYNLLRNVSSRDGVTALQVRMIS